MTCKWNVTCVYTFVLPQNLFIPKSFHNLCSYVLPNALAVRGNYSWELVFNNTSVSALVSLLMGRIGHTSNSSAQTGQTYNYCFCITATYTKNWPSLSMTNWWSRSWSTFQELTWSVHLFIYYWLFQTQVCPTDNWGERERAPHCFLVVP